MISQASSSRMGFPLGGLSVWATVVVLCVICRAAEDGLCRVGEQCGAEPSVITSQGFWAEIRRRGLELKVRRHTVEEPAYGGQPKRNRTAMVLVDDVFYGRAIMRIPRAALLSIETTPDSELRRALQRFLYEERALEVVHNVTGEDAVHLLSLALPLIAENRKPDSIYRQWLDVAQNETLPVLELTERQRGVLRGTTVEGAYDEMVRNRNLIEQTATNLTYFQRSPVSRKEAQWALAVIMRHARVVHPHQDVRETQDPRMYLFPLVDLLDVQLHPDPGVGITFQEEITLEGKREEEMVLQIARRDMAKGEEIFFWPGRLSNSEMVVRHGFAFQTNPVGIGRNISQPPNWSPDKESKVRKEYEKYNCSSLEAFELRFSIRGYPMRNFVRCYRVSWFLTNGWYSPALLGRLRELNRWPPPKKYGQEDWLAWTQADAEVNRVLLDYCRLMRQQLKETMETQVAEDFRRSADPTDRILWHMRSEESRTFKECIALAKTVASP